MQKSVRNTPLAGLSVAWFISIISCRIGELIYTSVIHDVPGNWLKTVAVAFLADLVYFLQSSCILFVIYVMLTFLSVKLARVVYSIPLFGLILVQVGLTVYFGKTSVLLGADLYSYSAEEISQTVGAAGGLSIGLLAAWPGLLGWSFLSFGFWSIAFRSGQAGRMG